MMGTSAEFLVIGGGPSAYGAVLALVKAGQRPTVLTPQGEWPGPNDDPGSSSKSGLARKSRFGSTAMYGYPKAAGIHFDVRGPVPVSAIPGGLSTVWGSNIQVFSGTDLDAWGTNAADMDSAYAAILATVPHQGADDGLSERFPWPVAFPGTQPLTPRVRRALHRASDSPESDVLVGVGRNATAPWGQGCVACGLCLDGCPERVVFDAGPALQALIEAYALPVIDGLASVVLDEGASRRVEYVDRVTQRTGSIPCETVLMAAGSIASSALLMRSELVPSEVTLDDTQVFYVPLVPTMGPQRGGTSYTLAQMFMTSAGLPGSPDFHLSLYESDPSFASRAEGLIGPLAKLIPGRAYRQLMAAIGFIPPSESGRIVLTRAPGQSGVTVRTRSNPHSATYVKSVLRTAAPHLRSLGMNLVAPLVQVSDVGASYHVGRLAAEDASVIEAAHGRVRDHDWIHVVDGAALPALPTGPVTLTMMANSYRIAHDLVGGRRG